MVAVPTVPGALPRVYAEGGSYAEKDALRKVAEQAAPTGRPAAPGRATGHRGTVPR
jgi:hypothetical protein